MGLIDEITEPERDSGLFIYPFPWSTDSLRNVDGILFILVYSTDAFDQPSYHELDW